MSIRARKRPVAYGQRRISGEAGRMSGVKEGLLLIRRVGTRSFLPPTRHLLRLLTDRYTDGWPDISLGRQIALPRTIPLAHLDVHATDLGASHTREKTVSMCCTWCAARDLFKTKSPPGPPTTECWVSARCTKNTRKKPAQFVRGVLTL